MGTLTVRNIQGRNNNAPLSPDGLVVTGICTATSFSGSGANLTGISTAAVPGISTQLHTVLNTVNASGIVTASAFSGDGGDLTGLNIPASFTWLEASLF